MDQDRASVITRNAVWNAVSIYQPEAAQCKPGIRQDQEMLLVPYAVNRVILVVFETAIDALNLEEKERSLLTIYEYIIHQLKRRLSSRTFFTIRRLRKRRNFNNTQIDQLQCFSIEKGSPKSEIKENQSSWL